MRTCPPLAYPLLALVLACGASAGSPEPPTARAGSGPVELRLDRDVYRPGDAVGLTLINHAPSGWAFNPCTRALERRDRGDWRLVDEAHRVCTMEAWLLEPGGRVEATTDLPEDLPAGEYRLRLALTAEGAAPGADARTEAASEPITVTP